ncbi:MAG: TPM domain-containing protein [Proteobacteria bacterium]|nr:TPM domain-containing protein [Pseudomonadota bacterium]
MAGTFARTMKHLGTGAGVVRRRFDRKAMERISDAIAAAEIGHAGEVRFAVEAMLPVRALLRHPDARSRAIEVFSQLRVWDTQDNTGVLLYLLWADRAIEIVADRGISDRLPADVWKPPCDRLSARLRQGDAVVEAVCECVAAIGDILRGALPMADHTPDELPDTPVML